MSKVSGSSEQVGEIIESLRGLVEQTDEARSTVIQIVAGLSAKIGDAGATVAMGQEAIHSLELALTAMSAANEPLENAQEALVGMASGG